MLKLETKEAEKRHRRKYNFQLHRENSPLRIISRTCEAVDRENVYSFYVSNIGHMCVQRILYSLHIYVPVS